MNKSKKSFSFEKLLLFLIIFFFSIIAILVYIISIPPKPQEQQTSPEKEITRKTVISPSDPQKLTNVSKNKWKTIDLPNNKIKVLSALQIDTAMNVTFEKDAPASVSSGIVFYNGLPETNPHTRKLSLYYYLKNKQWILQYQEGKKKKFYRVVGVEPKDASGSFSLLISSDGKRVMVTLPNKKTKIINLPNTLYDISNQMYLKPLLGPQSQINFTSLTYERVTL